MRGSSDLPLNATAKTQRPVASAASPDAPGGIERRRSPRVRSHSLLDGDVVDAKQSSSSFLGSTVDLSIGGCLIRTYEVLDPGMRVTVTLKLPEGDLRTAGTVVHQNEDAVGCRLYGVRFEPLAGDSNALLARHLSRFGVTVPSTGSATTKMRRTKVDTATERIVVEGYVHPSD